MQNLRWVRPYVQQSSFVRTGPRYDAVIATVPESPEPSAGDDPKVVVRVFAQTDVGQTREHNEDAFLVANLATGAPVEFEAAARDLASAGHGLLFLVADGMGGAASGELASGMASDVVLETLRTTWSAAAEPSGAIFAEALRDATEAANTKIHQFAREHSEHRGMGTTATIVGLFRDRLYLAQIGDSRAYMVRHGAAQQLTKDQSLMQRLVEAGELTQEEADVSDRRNIILQALGPEAQVTVDLTHQQLRRGDTLIVCSDGLSGLVRPSEMAGICAETADVRQLCQHLIDKANERGGHDNITVIAARFDGDALRASDTDDAVGYTTFALPGTLGTDDDSSARPAQAPFRSDPTPRYGTPMPTSAMLEEEFARARAAEDGAPDREALGAPTAVVNERRRAVQPLMWILLLLAAIAIFWLVRQFGSKP